MSCSKASHPMRPQVKATDLPAELLNQIVQNYGVPDINTIISLKVSCRKFYHTDGSLRVLRHVVQSNASLLFERICMDDEYERQREGKLVCRVCKQSHPADNFVDEELDKKAVDRVCKNSQRRLRLTPGDSFSYATILSSLPGGGTRGVFGTGMDLALGSPYNKDFKFWLQADAQNCAVMMIWKFILDLEFSEQSLKSQLTKFPVCICPHSRSDSEAFAEAVVRYLEDRAWYSSDPKCAVCGSKVGFRIQTLVCDERTGGEEMVMTFRAERRLGRLETAMGAEWIGQTEAPDSDAAR